MKERIYTAVLLFASLNLSALDYFPGQTSSNPKEGKWSTCTWGSHIDYDTANLPQKPGPSDRFLVRAGWVFEIDQDISVMSFATVSSKDVFAKNRTIKTKKSFGGQIPTTNFDSLVRLEKCTVENKGVFDITYWTEARDAGRVEFRFIDTEFSNRGGLSCIVPVNLAVVSPKQPCGATISLVGDSKFSFGGATIDSIFEETDPWYFKWNFEEKDGKLPSVVFVKKAQFKKCTVNLKIKGEFPQKKHTLVEFLDRKSGFNDAKFYINGDSYKLGETFTVNGKKAKLSLASARSNTPPSNLVLEVLK